MRRKEKRKEKKAEIEKPEMKKPEIKKPEKSAGEVKEVFTLKEAIALQKEGFVITDVKSEIIGIRSKSWILFKKEV